jgi:hypothetical protein
MITVYNYYIMKERCNMILKVKTCFQCYPKICCWYFIVVLPIFGVGKNMQVIAEE